MQTVRQQLLSPSMKQVRIDLVAVGSDGPSRNTTDYKLGRICLARHLGDPGIASIDVDRRYARQLLLREPSEFEDTARVPLLLCAECADLGCGALTVHVERLGALYVWRDFARAAPYSPELCASEIAARTGPFSFEAAQYESTFLAYC